MLTGTIVDKAWHSTPTQRIVEVILEVDQQSITYNIHEDLLRQHSAYLNEKLEDTAERKPLIINDVDKDTLDTFSLWLYSKKLTVNDLEHP